MPVIFDGHANTISIHTKNTTYQLAIGRYGYLLHLYYGKSVACDMTYVLQYHDRAFAPNPDDAGTDRTFSLDVLPQEFPVYGDGDYRTYAFNLKNSAGVYGCDLRYRSHRVLKGKFSIPGLPAVYADREAAETLEVVLEDQAGLVRVTLRYGVLPELDVITRAAEIENISQEEITLDRAYSAVLDFVSGSYDLIHFYGRHGMERTPERTPVQHGVLTYGSRRGMSSHQQNPFLILADRGTTEDCGSCYGMALLYSGNFKIEAETDQWSRTRVEIGVQDDMFDYPLKPGETFFTPEAALAYTGSGLTALSHLYHRLIRCHVCRGKYRDIRRPVLINNWEATMFDFTGEKIIQIAKQASALGVEMMVLDDGWFGGRIDSDNAGLGDWVVNETKLGGPLAHVSDEIHRLGMKFGLWVEPEMVNEDSDLYRTHPDWAFRIPGRKPQRGRNQLVLDFSRPEIADYIFDQFAKVLDSAKIEYVKMDMNRGICDVFTGGDGSQNYGAIMHRYVLGVYRFLEKLLNRYPDLLIEGCSGGGGRFDAGMLYYTPQIWCSDDTDAIERLTIQYGTSFCYPVSAVGSHVSAVPNQQTGRSVELHTRAVVAMNGSFGYELDLNLLSEAEKEEVRQQIRDYRKYWDLIQNGRYYRGTAPGTDTDVVSWNYVSQDGSEALLLFVTTDTHCNPPQPYVKCKGLDGRALYREEYSGICCSGNALAELGVPVPLVSGEYHAWQLHFIRES